MKDIFNLRLALPRQFAVWASDIVLDYLSNLERDLPLQNLSEKLVILLRLLSRQRDQTMKASNIKDMLLEKGRYTFFIQRAMKNRKPDFHQSPIDDFTSTVSMIFIGGITK